MNNLIQRDVGWMAGSEAATAVTGGVEMLSYGYIRQGCLIAPYSPPPLCLLWGDSSCPTSSQGAGLSMLEHCSSFHTKSLLSVNSSSEDIMDRDRLSSPFPLFSLLDA